MTFYIDNTNSYEIDETQPMSGQPQATKDYISGLVVPSDINESGGGNTRLLSTIKHVSGYVSGISYVGCYKNSIESPAFGALSNNPSSFLILNDI